MPARSVAPSQTTRPTISTCASFSSSTPCRQTARTARGPLGHACALARCYCFFRVCGRRCPTRKFAFDVPRCLDFGVGLAHY
eukprot:4092735-Pleurochrysis_carterae.AAC.2